MSQTSIWSWPPASPTPRPSSSAWTAPGPAGTRRSYGWPTTWRFPASTQGLDQPLQGGLRHAQLLPDGGQGHLGLPQLHSGPLDSWGEGFVHHLYPPRDNVGVKGKTCFTSDGRKRVQRWGYAVRPWKFLRTEVRYIGIQQKKNYCDISIITIFFY